MPIPREKFVKGLLQTERSDKAFEKLARKILSKHFGVELSSKRIPKVPKEFDYVSADNQIIGDAKYYTMLKGGGDPSGKFSIIAEHVWLLEKTKAKVKFLVFGNDRRVPERWLKKHEHLVSGIGFFFIDEKGQLVQLL